MNREGVSLQELNDELKAKMKFNLQLYGFDLTVEQLEKKLTVDELELIFNSTSTYSKENMALIAVKEIITNRRGTLKLVIWKNGKFSIFNKDAKPESISIFSIPYDYRGNHIWDYLKVGMYVAFSSVYWKQELRIGVLTDCTTKVEAEKWLSLFTDCLQKTTGFGAHEEMQSLRHVDSEGTLTTKDLEDHKLLLEQTITLIQQAEKKEIVDRDTALATKIIITGNKIGIQALDNRTYTIEVPNGCELKKESWVTYVYRHRYRWTQFIQELSKKQTFLDEVTNQLIASNFKWFKLSVDNKPKVKIAIKVVTNSRGSDMTLTYLNDRRVASEDLRRAIYEYFVQGLVLINPAGQSENLGEAEKQKALDIRKQKDEAIVTSGITGYINDLEGESPISIGLEKVGINWQLVIGEKKILIKGGVETIKSLERVLKGTAQGYNARHSTEELFERLSKIIGEEQAIEIITEAKILGKLAKALG